MDRFAAQQVEEVKAANQAYYIALSARDLDAMQRLWSTSSDAVNIAPPTRPVAHVGWIAVKDNYEKFWSSLDELTVSMQEPMIRVEGNVAWVFGTEQATRRTKTGQIASGPNFGTSIFVNRNGRWLMVFHQSLLNPS